MNKIFIYYSHYLFINFETFKIRWIKKDYCQITKIISKSIYFVNLFDDMDFEKC